jgi:hypothetical protein
MPIDVDRIRAETPGCSMVTHFNHSSCSLPPLQVTQAVTEHLQREGSVALTSLGTSYSVFVGLTTYQILWLDRLMQQSPWFK